MGYREFGRATAGMVLEGVFSGFLGGRVSFCFYDVRNFG